MVRVLGGPDAGGRALHDSSANANANAFGPCTVALAAGQCDSSRYPDITHAAWRESLGRLHGVPPARIAIAARASEFIMRIATALARPGGAMQVPRHAYGAQLRDGASFGLPGDVRLAVLAPAQQDALAAAWAAVR